MDSKNNANYSLLLYRTELNAKLIQGHWTRDNFPLIFSTAVQLYLVLNEQNSHLPARLEIISTIVECIHYVAQEQIKRLDIKDKLPNNNAGKDTQVDVNEFLSLPKQHDVEAKKNANFHSVSVSTSVLAPSIWHFILDLCVNGGAVSFVDVLIQTTVYQNLLQSDTIQETRNWNPHSMLLPDEHHFKHKLSQALFDLTFFWITNHHIRSSDWMSIAVFISNQVQSITKPGETETESLIEIASEVFKSILDVTQKLMPSLTIHTRDVIHAGTNELFTLYLQPDRLLSKTITNRSNSSKSCCFSICCKSPSSKKPKLIPSKSSCLPSHVKK